MGAGNGPPRCGAAAVAQDVVDRRAKIRESRVPTGEYSGEVIAGQRPLVRMAPVILAQKAPEQVYPAIIHRPPEGMQAVIVRHSVGGAAISAAESNSRPSI